MTREELYARPWAKLIANACNRRDGEALRAVLGEMGAVRLLLLRDVLDMRHMEIILRGEVLPCQS